MWCMCNFTEKEIDFVFENLPKYGPKYCSVVLNRPKHQIERFARSKNIYKIGTDKHPSMQKINPEQFWNIEKKEIAYFLGYFWADGSIYYKKQKMGEVFSITLEINSEDARDIHNIMLNIGKWAVNFRKRQETWKETTTFSTNSKDIYKFLEENDYKIKSNTEPTKILEKIPQHLHKYFWRGYFDGDGGLNIYEWKNKLISNIQFCSTFESSWQELSNLCNSLEIQNPYIRQEVSKKGHKCSKFSLVRKADMLKFCHFLMESEIGLVRKSNKMKKFLEIYKNGNIHGVDWKKILLNENI